MREMDSKMVTETIFTLLQDGCYHLSDDVIAALRRIVARDFPVTVVNDIYGGNLYEEGRSQYRPAAPNPAAVP